MVKNRCQVLISGKMKGIGLAQSGDSLVTTGLGPTVGVQIGMQTSTDPPMDVGPSAKDGLGKSDFHVSIGPVFSPFLKKLELTLSQKAGLRNVH